MALPPYAEYLGVVVEPDAPRPDASGPVVRLPDGAHLLGRPGFLHGGAIAGLLELAALIALADEISDDRRPKPINFTVDFMRGGRLRDTFAAGHVTRIGTRIANVGAIAWQDDRNRPIAAGRLNLLLREGPR